MRLQLHPERIRIRPAVRGPQMLDKSAVNRPADRSEFGGIPCNVEHLLVRSISARIQPARQAGCRSGKKSRGLRRGVPGALMRFLPDA
jgi:hypothetical protein